MPEPSPAPLSFSKNLIAGATAGASELLVMYPLDVVKTRFQLLAGSGRSPSIIDALQGLRKEGLSRMYRGILAPLAVEPLKRAIKFSANAQYKAMIIGDNAPTVLNSAACGALAGVTECFAIAPAEVIKVRMQAKERASAYKNTADAFTKMLRMEGPAVFLQGIEPALWRQSLWNGSFFACGFAMKKYMLWEPSTRPSELGRNFVAGLVGGTVGTTLNTPFDVVTSRMRNVLPGDVSPYRNAWQGVMLVARQEGAQALFKGYLPKVLRLGPGGGILLMVYEVIAGYLR